jgi:two-component system chemotaxis response regulator CheY
MTILAVDDSASVRAAVRFTLEGAGYRALEASDGEDALGKLSADVRLVLTDLNMPRLDGIELVKRIRANPSFRGLPIVMLTTESQDAKKQAGRAAGATAWIVKPFRPEQLLAVVKKVLG